jgi:hypothetical protein
MYLIIFGTEILKVEIKVKALVLKLRILNKGWNLAINNN